MSEIRGEGTHGRKRAHETLEVRWPVCQLPPPPQKTEKKKKAIKEKGSGGTFSWMRSQKIMGYIVLLLLHGKL